MRTTALLLALLLLLFATSLPGAVAAAPLSSSSRLQDLVNRGEYDQALSETRKTHELFPYNETARANLAALYALIAQREMKQNRYREACGYLEEARSLEPQNLSWLLMRGVALYLAKDYDAARSELEQAPENVTALTYLGKISYDTGDLATALARWQSALALEPKNAAIKELAEKATREAAVESRMDKGYSSMFDITFDAELPQALSAEVMDALESAYATVGADFELFPQSRVPVILYTRSDYRSVTEGPDWSGGLYDGKIRLPLGGTNHLTPQLRAVIFHEYTHVLVHELTRGRAPTWLNEGLAEVEGRREFAPPLHALAEARRSNALLGKASLSAPFTSLSGNKVLLAYQQSYSLVQFMVERYGWYAVRQILKSLGERVPVEKAVARGLQDWSLDLPGVMQEWQAALSE
ncbi:hypothetical protein LPW11_01610 [Geomonas sp. RF6]|uniref:peptidase MA family metallohydrolase n=1 Tax=Geomonas sp. RF6 TaxID=2897342 RepID=UPI001E5518E8|nr:tetratricopeptide repeat protein [Geomonas sp. RF6]UFS70893.1 hypothetical protein LPW11_01610 [Geomonas sp. RF6]